MPRLAKSIVPRTMRQVSQALPTHVHCDSARRSRSGSGAITWPKAGSRRHRPSRTRVRVLAEQTGDPSIRVVAHRAAGTTAFWTGQFAEADRELTECLRILGNGSHYRPFASDLGVSPRSLVLSDLAAVLFAVGRPADARQAIKNARSSLEGTQHPFHECYSLAFRAG